MLRVTTRIPTEIFKRFQAEPVEASITKRIRSIKLFIFKNVLV
jgi:hypothetical protein